HLRIAQELGANIEDPSINATISSPLPNGSAGGKTAGDGKIRLGLCPGAEYGPAKRWLPERFTEVAATVAAEHSVEWRLFGTSADAEIGDAIARTLEDKCVNRIGQTTLEQLIDELRTCRLLLTNDTGTMHLAALIGIPRVS